MGYGQINIATAAASIVRASSSHLQRLNREYIKNISSGKFTSPHSLSCTCWRWQGEFTKLQNDNEIDNDDGDVINGDVMMMTGDDEYWMQWKPTCTRVRGSDYDDGDGDVFWKRSRPKWSDLQDEIFLISGVQRVIKFKSQSSHACACTMHHALCLHMRLKI